MRPTLEKDHKELERVLDGLLAEDKEISFQEVARRHPTIKYAPSFLDGRRKELIENAQTGRSVRGPKSAAGGMPAGGDVIGIGSCPHLRRGAPPSRRQAVEAENSV